MALGLGAWALWVLWRNFPLLRYLALTPGAWDSYCLGPFLTGTAWPALAAAGWIAAACKLQGLALGGALGVWLLWSPRRRRGVWSFALGAALPALPWFLRTWLATGNPVWPFFSGLRGRARLLLSEGPLALYAVNAGRPR